jgi:beta-glucosidase
VIFGDYNPGGKLPVTFPRSVGQLPFNFPYKPGAHAIQGKKDDPNGFGQASIEGALYPYGFGLSYTQFAYADLNVTPAINSEGEVTVTCAITNRGSRVGDEVPQLYFRQVVSSVTTYELSLVGFERVSLAPGETKTVTFKFPARELALINRAGQRVVEPGEFLVHVGSSSADLRLHGKFLVRSL